MANFHTPKKELDEEMREPMTDLPLDQIEPKGKGGADDNARYLRGVADNLKRAGYDPADY